MSPTAAAKGRASPEPDPRVTLRRAGLAAAHLEGVVEAERFSPTRTVQVTAPSLALRTAPGAGAEQV
ncbi:hypothetical protein ACNJUT_22075, partial [Mycobacterium tuberculosis]